MTPALRVDLRLDPGEYGVQTELEAALEVVADVGVPDQLVEFVLAVEAVCAVSGGAEPSPRRWRGAAVPGEGLTVRTEAFTAVLGEPDAHGEPELTLVRRA